MNLFVAALVIVALCVTVLGINVFFLHKDFPHFDVGSNEQMLRRNIRCFKDEDALLHGKKSCSTDCENCKRI